MTTASNSEPYVPPLVSVPRLGRGLRWSEVVKEMEEEAQGDSPVQEAS